MKKVFLLLTVVTFMIILTVQSFAWGNDVIFDPSTPSTPQFMVTITRPEGDESTFKKNYVICANTNEDDVEIMVLKYHKATDTYKPINGLESNSKWNIGKSGIFVKQIELTKVGDHNLRVVAYKKNETKFQLGSRLQVNNYTVTLLDSGIKEAIKTGFFKLTDMLSDLLK